MLTTHSLIIGDMLSVVGVVGGVVGGEETEVDAVMEEKDILHL